MRKVDIGFSQETRSEKEPIAFMALVGQSHGDRWRRVKSADFTRGLTRERK
jgi:hypothetical protein